MYRPLAAIAAAALLATGAMAQRGVERWSATSRTATAITGDIVLSPTRLTTAGKTFPLAVVADVKDFKNNSDPAAARILRVTTPANPVLLNGNRLCSAPVRWIAVWREQRGDLSMAVFRGTARPTGIDTPGLCATFLYSRP